MSTLMALLRMGPPLVGTGVGERNVLSQRPEALTHTLTHTAAHSRDGSSNPYRESAAPAARPRRTVTAGGLA